MSCDYLGNPMLTDEQRKAMTTIEDQDPYFPLIPKERRQAYIDSMTNDEQAPYGRADEFLIGPLYKPTDRAPMLSDAQTTDMLMMEHHRRGGMNNLEATRFIRDFYEAKITSGELRAVKKVRFANGVCEECGIVEQVMVDCVLSNCCPGCGAEIIKA